MRILFADCDKLLLEAMQTFMWRRGHEAKAASNGLECLEQLHDYMPNVLVLDSELLWGGSEGILAEMRADPSLFKIPVVLMSDSPWQFGQNRPSNSVVWMKKPFRLRVLLEQLMILACASDVMRPNSGHSYQTV